MHRSLAYHSHALVSGRVTIPGWPPVVAWRTAAGGTTF